MSRVIIYRGYGWAALAAIGVGVFIGMGLNSMAGRGSKNLSILPVGVGFIVAGLALFALGWWLNVIRHGNERARDLARFDDAAARVAPQGGPQDPWPTAPGQTEEYRQIMTMKAAREQQWHKARNPHTFFFIPIQWLGIALALGGVALAIAGLNR